MKNPWGFILLVGFAAFFYKNDSFGAVSDSGCIACHTDMKKLQAIVEKLPKKEKSGESAGTG